MTAYSVQQLQGVGGRPLPANTFVYIRQIRPHMGGIFRAAVSSGGGVGSVDVLNGTSWAPVQGGLFVDTSFHYVACSIVANDAGNFRTDVLEFTLSAQHHAFNCNPNAADA